MTCDYEYYNLYGPKLMDQEQTSRTSYIESVSRYVRTEWLSKQSFCYEDQKSVELFSTVTHSGLTFGFNLNEKIYDKKS
jgi:hypothetical protein